MSHGTDSALAKYQIFAERVSEKFTDILAHNPSSMQCRNGCNSCCAPNLSVFTIEAEYIHRYLQSSPALRAQVHANAAKDPFKGTRCAFLGPAGDCLIYEARPIVCRSHGAPGFYPNFDDSDEPHYDVCPLNFTDIELQSLAAVNFINIGILNATLVGLNRELGEDSGKRFTLDQNLSETSPLQQQQEST